MELSELLSSLDLEEVGDGRYVGTNAIAGPGVVFGGQLIGQAVVAAARGHADKRVKTVHTVFARSGAPDTPVDVDVDVMHAGRAFASSAVTIRQGDRLCTRSLVLLSADEPDLIRHAEEMRAVASPDQSSRLAHGAPAWDARIVGDVDISDPGAVGPAELDVWSRFAGAPDDPITNQALLAYATDPFLIATAMRPHAGVGQSQAHVSLSTGVVSHTLTFHEPFRAGEWLLLAHRSPYAGRGRTYGRADVFTEDGRLVASFVQDNMVRPVPDGSPPRL